MLNYLGRTQNSIDRLKNRIYPKSLLEFEDNGDLASSSSFDANIDGILKLSDETEVQLDRYFPEVHRLKVLKEKEGSIDFDKANRDQDKPRELKDIYFL